VYKAWIKVNQTIENENPLIMTEPLFYNSKIKIGQKPFFILEWYQKDIYRINDIVNERREFKNWNSI
jgi:hypothetical protein